MRKKVTVKNKEKIKIKIADLNPNTWIIISNVNYINIPVKDRNWQGVLKTRPNYMLWFSKLHQISAEIHFKYMYIDKVKVQKNGKTCKMKISKESTTSYINIKWSRLQKQRKLAKRVMLHNSKVSVHQEDTAILNIYASKNRVVKYVKQKQVKLKGRKR